MGNVPVSLLWPPVTEGRERGMPPPYRGLRTGGGFILAGAASVGEVRADNLRAMTEAVMEYGVYPVRRAGCRPESSPKESASQAASLIGVGTVCRCFLLHREKRSYREVLARAGSKCSSSLSYRFEAVLNCLPAVDQSFSFPPQSSRTRHMDDTSTMDCRPKSRKRLKRRAEGGRGMS